MGSVVRKRTLCVLALLVLVFFVSAPHIASAASLQTTFANTYLQYQVQNEVLYIGAVAHDADGNNYYCIEAGAPLSFTVNAVQRVDDSDESRAMGWLMDTYRDNRDMQVHAAIGVLVHDRYDRNPAIWAQHRAVIMKTYPSLQSKSQELWDQATSHTVHSASVTQTYVDGIRRGRVSVNLNTAGGSAVSGISYTLTVQGPALFDNMQSSVRGVTGSQPAVHEWKATGEGAVTVSIQYETQHVEQMLSSQDLLTAARSEMTDGNAITFNVRKTFTPTITTSVQDKVMDFRAPIIDNVTSGVHGENSFWFPNLELKANGWYFDGLTHHELTEAITPNPGETAVQFLARLRQLGYIPSAYGSTVFTAPDQTKQVSAKTTISGAELYTASEQGSFGTWVWAFELSALSDTAREYVDSDVVSGFREKEETDVHRATLKVESTVTEHSATVGSELSDTITVAGFPSDHGNFTGNSFFGFEPDVGYASVSVWWSGDTTDSSKDAQYKPATVAVPQSGSHHELIGTWFYPAVNGTVRVGAEAPDAYGNPVNIEAKKHGWYVFIWSFVGDSRVMPYASAYNDAWERTRVEQVVTARPATITTHVNNETVNISESFADIADIQGDFKQGDYVEFSAYGPLKENEEPISGELLVDSAKVEINPALPIQTLASPSVSTPQEGYVYWKATIFTREGDVLATHALGIKDETVSVSPVDQNPIEIPKLAQTGTNVIAMLVIMVSGVSTATMMVVCIKRRSCN